MDATRTTAAIQRFLDALAVAGGSTPAEPIVAGLLARATRRLQSLCARMLRRSYPRLARPPLNLESGDVLGAVVERLLKALREARPRDVRQFFALANRHMLWELNELARRLDQQARPQELHDSRVPAREDGEPAGSSATERRILDAIAALPDPEREAFSLVRIQGMAQTEAALLLGVSSKTVQRRLQRSLLLLAEALDDLAPPEDDALAARH